MIKLVGYEDRYDEMLSSRNRVSDVYIAVFFSINENENENVDKTITKLKR